MAESDHNEIVILKINVEKTINTQYHWGRLPGKEYFVFCLDFYHIFHKVSSSVVCFFLIYFTCIFYLSSKTLQSISVELTVKSKQMTRNVGMCAQQTEKRLRGMNLRSIVFLHGIICINYTWPMYLSWVG